MADSSELCRNSQRTEGVRAVMDAQGIKDAATRKALEREAYRIATQDGLTGLHNRAGLEDAFAYSMHRASEHRAPLGVVLLDVDSFHSYNGQFGHPQGDEALREAGRRLRHSVRDVGDHVGRYGGEEFALLLSGESRDAGGKQLDEGLLGMLAERICRSIRTMRIGASSSLENPTALYGKDGDRQKRFDELTVSVGGILIPSDAGVVSFDDAFGAADRMLYARKSKGRDGYDVGIFQPVTTRV